MNSKTVKKPIVIFLMGPTASGKTALAMELHQKKDCELISVDSALVYRGLDIGTAKPTPEELVKAPHHLIDICNISEPYSASQFCVDAKEIIETCVAKGKTPVLVGGTMLYFKALRDGLADLPKADQTLREQLATEAKQNSWSFMHDKLKKIDAKSAERIKENDSQRIQRALEVFMISGKTLSQYFAEQQRESLPHPILNLAIAPNERSILTARIEQRFDQMLADGFIDEVKRLLCEPLVSQDLPALRSVGYRQVCEYLAGDIDIEQMREKAIIASRQLAKRQMTWLRRWPELNWLETGNSENYQLTCRLIDAPN